MSVFRRVMLGRGGVFEIPDGAIIYTASAKLNIPVSALKHRFKGGVGYVISEGESLNYIFEGTDVETVIIPNHITRISGSFDAGDFYNCSKLRTITIPSSVKVIGSNSIGYCPSLETLIIPSTVERMQNNFVGCTGVLFLESGLEATFQNAQFSEIHFLGELEASDNLCTGNKYLQKVVFDGKASIIPGSAFRNCSNLNSVIIGNSVTWIDTWVFENCTSLTSVTIPNSVTMLRNGAFEGCISIESVIIGNGITEIASSTFRNCTSMQYCDFSTHESVPTLMDTSAFYAIPSDCKIIVPDALYDEWIAATNWSTYASYIIKKSDWDASQTTE